MIVSTVGAAKQASQRVPQLDWVVTACADHTASLRRCTTHVRIPAEVIDQLVTTDLCCRRLRQTQTNKFTILLSTKYTGNVSLYFVALILRQNQTINKNIKHNMQLEKMTLDQQVLYLVI